MHPDFVWFSIAGGTVCSGSLKRGGSRVNMRRREVRQKTGSGLSMNFLFPAIGHQRSILPTWRSRVDDLSKARVQSPASRWIRLDLGAGFALMAAHERRHLWQARRLTERPDFPKA